MSIEGNKALVRRYVDAISRNNLSVIDQLVAETVLLHEPPGDQRTDPAALKRSFAENREIFPDLTWEIGEMVAEGDLVAYFRTVRGTFSRDIPTPQGRYPATGTTVTTSGLTICRIAGGKIVEVWDRVDELGFLQQIGGAISPPETTTS